MERPIYLDHAATTPCDPRVIDVLAACLGAEGAFGNPSSPHLYGHEAYARVEAARVQVAALFGCRAEEVVFTSGATEANNLAVLGTLRAAGGARHLITSRIEHKSVLDAARQLEREGHRVTYLAPDSEGRIEAREVREALRPDTALVSLMAVNNELGVCADIDALAAVCAERGVPLHVDAVQAAGKLVLEAPRRPVTLMSISGHKLYGPKGVGALFVARSHRASLRPLLFGGGQEQGLRSGTPAVPLIAALGCACELAQSLRESEQPRLAQLEARLWAGLSVLPGVLRNGHATQRVAGLLNLSFAGVEGESLLAALPGLALSAGSACNAEQGEPSYVLRALGRDDQQARSSLRFSLGRATTPAQIDRTVELVCRAVERLRAAAPAA